MTSTPKEIRDGIAAARETTERHLASFAPSPAPASGAETPKPTCECKGVRSFFNLLCDECGLPAAKGTTEFRESSRLPGSCGHAILHIPAVPTPPSDAGTSERETETRPCKNCGQQKHEHQYFIWGWKCRASRFVGEDDSDKQYFRPSSASESPAPAAEGPRDDDDGDDSYMVCEVRVNIGEAMEECGESLPCHRHGPKPAAALPGAEAGTPDDSWWTSERVRSLRDAINDTAFDCDPACDSHAHTETCNRRNEPSFILAVQQARLAALTSEVRALREDKARLDWMDEHTAGVEVADNEVGTLTVQSNLDYRQVGGGEAIRDAIDAARLASPSPTGAP